MSKPLTDKQKAFCDYYLVDFNATHAAIKAGYSKKTAKSQGQRMLTFVVIQNYLSEIKKKRAEKYEVTVAKTIQEIGRIAFQDARKFYNEDGSLIPIHLLDDDAAAVIAGMDVEELYDYSRGERTQIGIVKKIKRYDKTKALEMLGRHFGVFEKDNEQLKNEVAITLNLGK